MADLIDAAKEYSSSEAYGIAHGLWAAGGLKDDIRNVIKDGDLVIQECRAIIDKALDPRDLHDYIEADEVEAFSDLLDEIDEGKIKTDMDSYAAVKEAANTLMFKSDNTIGRLVYSDLLTVGLKSMTYISPYVFGDDERIEIPFSNILSVACDSPWYAVSDNVVIKQKAGAAILFEADNGAACEVISDFINSRIRDWQSSL